MMSYFECMLEKHGAPEEKSVEYRFSLPEMLFLDH